MSTPRTELIDTQRGLEQLRATLAGATCFFLDTEFDSNRGGKQLCLRQISDGTGAVHLVDALRLDSLDALRPLLADRSRQWVLHAGLQDVELLAERLRLEAVPRVFDTQVAWALSSAEFSVSLAYLRFRVLGVRSGKPHQSDDWRRRPLPASQLDYAAADIEDLPALHQKLGARLAERGRSEMVYAASAELVWPVRDPPEPLSLESFRNAWQLDAHSQAALRFLVDWYNALPSGERFSAPDGKTLLAIASRLPEGVDDLLRMKGVNRRFAGEHGRELVKGMLRAAAEADTASFEPIDPPPYASFEQIRTDGWLALARAELSVELGVAPELAFPSRVMAKLRERIAMSGDVREGVEVFVGWRKELLAEAYLAFAESRATSSAKISK